MAKARTSDELAGFSERLKAARARARLSQEELASTASLSEAAVKKWEGGVNLPSYEASLALCVALNIEPNYLFGWEHELAQKPAANRHRVLNEIWLALSDLPPDMLSSIRYLVLKISEAVSGQTRS